MGSFIFCPFAFRSDKMCRDVRRYVETARFFVVYCRLCEWFCCCETLFMLCAFMPLYVSASSGSKYTGLVNKVQKLSAEHVISQGDRYFAQGRKEEAMVLYMVVCNRSDDKMTEKEIHDCASANLKVGDMYYSIGNYTKALEFYISGLKICEMGKERKSIALFYKSIGNVYCMFHDFENGARFFKTGVGYCVGDFDIDTKRKLLVNLTMLYVYMNRPDIARGYLRESVRLRKSDNPVDAFMHGYTYGLVAASEGRYREAVSCFRRLAVSAASGNVPGKYECYAYQELCKAYFKMGVMDSALFYFDKCEHTSQRYGIQYLFIEPLKYVSAVYEKMGDTAKAMEYKARFLTMGDSVFNRRKFDAVRNVQFQYEMDKTGREIAGLRHLQEKSRQTIVYQRTVMFLVFAAMLMVTVFLVVMYRQNKKLNRSYAGLYALNKESMDKQEYMNRRHVENMNRISNLENEIARLVEAEGAETVPAGVMSEDCKYKSSNLSGSQQQALAEAIADVMENSEEFCSDNFSLDRLASLVGSNSKYVSQVINGIYHKNFSNYVNEYRVRTACRRLTDTERYGNLTVKAVGASVGYRSHASFVNIFRKVTGLTPSLYQKMAREDANMLL